MRWILSDIVCLRVFSILAISAIDLPCRKYAIKRRRCAIVSRPACSRRAAAFHAMLRCSARMSRSHSSMSPDAIKSCREVEILLYTAAVMLAVIGVVHPLQRVGYCLDLGEVLLGVLRVRREIILHGDALYRSVCKAVHDRFAVSACVRLVPVQPA